MSKSLIKPTEIIPTSLSTDKQWISFYDSLKDSLGRKDAVIVFGEFWSKRGGNISANTSFFRNEMQDRGITINPDGFMNKVAELTDDVTDMVGDLFSIGKMTMIIGISISALLLIVILYRISKNGVSASYMGTGVKV